MSLLSPHNSNIFSVNTHRQEADFSRARVVSRHFSARARIGLRSGVGVGIDAVSTTVKRSFNGKSRRMSEVVPCCRAASRRVCTWSKTRAHLTLERFARFGCDLDSGTQNSIVRATVKVASENKQRRGREACIGLKSQGARPYFREERALSFLPDPLLDQESRITPQRAGG